MTSQKELKQIVISALRKVTFVQACKLYMRGSATDYTSNCSIKCHSKRGGCTTVDE